MDITPVCALKPYEHGNRIRVRVCRMWTVKGIGNNSQALSLECVFVDKNGDTIHATIQPWEMKHFQTILKAGEIYEISKFHIVRSKTSNKIVPHDGMLELNKRVQIFHLEDTHPPIPRHGFNFLQFDELLSRLDNDVILTDIFGCLIALQATEVVSVHNIRYEKKRDLRVQNIKNEEIRITLWADVAMNFDEQILATLSPPVFIAITGLKIKEYQGKPVLSSSYSTMCFFNPDVPQLFEYKKKFQNMKSPIVTLPPSARSEVTNETMKNIESKQIQELYLLDPAANKNKTFACQATIMEYDLSRGWWYKSCSNCHKNVKPSSTGFSCFTHGPLNKAPEPWYKINCIVEDNTDQTNFLIIGKAAEKLLGISCQTLVIEQGYDDPYRLPPHLEKLIGTVKKFLIRFGKQENEYYKLDFVVSAIIDETLPQLLVDQMQANIPPTPSPTPQIVTTTPITSSQSHLTETTLKTSKGVKRKLFSESKEITPHSTKQTHVEENASENDPDSIHLPISAFKDKSLTKKIKKER